MLRYLSQSPLRLKRVLVRVDFNVPIAHGRVSDDFRIRATLPTIRHLLRQRNSVILLAHASDKRQSLRLLAGHLSRLLGERVTFRRDPFSEYAPRESSRVVLMENLRFWPGEETQDKKFAKILADLGDAYVNDAFGAAHRRGASLTVLPRLLPSYLGLLFERELAELGRIIRQPKRPLVAIFGGAKIETKIPILRRFMRLADRVLVGGAIANALLAVRAFPIGRSHPPFPRSVSRLIRQLVQSPKLILPVDGVLAQSRFSRRGRIVSFDRLSPQSVILDAGPRTLNRFRREIASSRMVVWNGPLGITEVRAFSRGTEALARALARSRAEVVIGGGDLAAVVDRMGLLGSFRHVSTGGGAMLTYLAGGKLPALEALKKSHRD